MKRKMMMMAMIFGFIAVGRAQTVSDFENLTLPADTFWNGADFSGGFSSGNVYFYNAYAFDSIYGGYWTSGFAYSSMRDSLTAGFTNMYSARTASGWNGSTTYAIGQHEASIRLQGDAFGKAVYGFYVTNSTYAALSMRDGDFFSKQFGGPSGNDPDWFKLSVIGWDGCCQKYDTVHVYLADYRFTDNSQDYILSTWQWVDLLPLGDVDSLQFLLSSSDVGMYGMNTPPFFCMDNFTTADSWAAISENFEIRVFLYPNPVAEILHVAPDGFTQKKPLRFSIFAANGSMVLSGTTSTEKFDVDVSVLPAGLYSIELREENFRAASRFLISR